MNIRNNDKTLPKRTGAQTQKTRQRTSIEPMVRDYLGEAARDDRKATGKQIRERVTERLHFEGFNMDLPGVRKIQDIAKEARGKKGIQLDDVWSLAVRILWIPPEATGDLLAVWKYCLTVNRKFTIREAIWGARLRSALPEATPQHLYEVALAYARRERTEESMKQHLSFADLDAQLAFLREKSSIHEWEYQQAVRTGVVPLSEGRWKPRYIQEAPEALEWQYAPSALTLPGNYFARAIEKIIYEQQQHFLSAGERKFFKEGKLSWLPQAHNVMVFWLQRITNSVKKWQGINLGSGGGLPGDKERAEWKDMAQDLVSLVIQRAQMLEALQKWYAAGGSFGELWNSLEAKKLPKFFKELGFTRKNLRESIPGIEPITVFLKNFLNKLGMDEFCNPLKGGEDSDRERHKMRGSIQPRGKAGMSIDPVQNSSRGRTQDIVAKER